MFGILSDPDAITLPRSDLQRTSDVLLECSQALFMAGVQFDAISDMCKIANPSQSEDGDPVYNVADALLLARDAGFRLASGYVVLRRTDEVTPVALFGPDGDFFAGTEIMIKASDASFDRGFDAGFDDGKDEGYEEGYNASEAEYVEVSFLSRTARPFLCGLLSAGMLYASVAAYQFFPFFH